LTTKTQCSSNVQMKIWLECQPSHRRSRAAKKQGSGYFDI